MANWYGASRSNYFTVKDETAFKDWVAGTPDLMLLEDQGKFGIAVESGEGWPSMRSDAWSGEDVEVDIVSELSAHLAEGQVAVLVESGAEKLRYVTGNAVAVAWDGRWTQVNLSDIYAKAKAEFGVEPTDASY